MIYGIEKELAVFLQAVLAGNLIYLVYTVLRVWRRIIRHNLFWISAEDLIYWIGTGFYLFVKIYETCNGTIRWYFIVGVLVGTIVTHYIIKKILKIYCEKVKNRVI